MAGEDQPSSDERTEEATPERRDDFRERGQIAVSRDLSSVLALGGCAMFFSFGGGMLLSQMQRILVTSFQNVGTLKVTPGSFLVIMEKQWTNVLMNALPFFLVAGSIAALSTLLQTRGNISWQKLAPDFSRLSLLKGLPRMVNLQAGVELIKGVVKLVIVGTVAFLILKGEWAKAPTLMRFGVKDAWGHWGEITLQLFFATTGILLVVAGFDYLYNFITYERQMRMTKQEVKEEYKRREVDPHVKARMRRMQRDATSRKMVEASRTATVLVTNPTHYAIALKYELGMSAPVVVAKGVDFLALRMREAAKENNIPIVENKPLARTLYKVVEVGQEIPESLYKAVSEIIRYVFNLKKIRIPKGRNRVAAEGRV